MKETRKFRREIKVKDEFTRCPSRLICHQIIDGLPCKTGGKFCILFWSSYLTKFGPKRTTKISQNHLMFSFTYFRQFLSTPIDLTSFFVVSNEIFDWSLHRDIHSHYWLLLTVPPRVTVMYQLLSRAWILDAPYSYKVNLYAFLKDQTPLILKNTFFPNSLT